MSESSRTEIHDVVLRYCRGIDRLDLELVRSAYHPGAIDHHTGFDGTVEEYLPWVRAALERFTGTLHVVANHIAEIDGDVAVAETYCNASHWGEPLDDPRRNFTSGSRYVDVMTREAGRWAIKERWSVREWTRSDAGRLMPKEGSGPNPARDRTDPVYRAQEIAARLRG